MNESEAARKVAKPFSQVDHLREWNVAFLQAGLDVTFVLPTFAPLSNELFIYTVIHAEDD